MPAPIKVSLSKEEDQQLLNLQQHPETPPRVRYRAEIVRLNAYGWSVSQIADYKKLSSHTVRKSLRNWSNQGLEGLWEAGGRGRKKGWKEEDIQYLEITIEQEQRTYNSRQLAAKLKQDRGVKLSPDRIRKLLKKKGWRWKRTRYKPPPTANPEYKKAKQADLEWLLWSHSAGEICLKFLDESGFCLWSPVSYSYAKVGQQKVLQQTKKRGKRLNILGLYSPKVSFDYGLKLGSFKGNSYLKLMNWQAEQAQKRLLETGQITVIVQDNHPVHKSKEVRQYWNQWQEQGLYLFHLPTYSSEMNLIEIEWHQIKTHELAGRIFEDEYDLAIAVIDGVETRAQKRQHSTERFLFNSA
jgi:transposase